MRIKIKVGESDGHTSLASLELINMTSAESWSKSFNVSSRSTFNLPW